MLVEEGVFIELGGEEAAQERGWGADGAGGGEGEGEGFEVHIFMHYVYHSGLLQHCGAGVATPDPCEAPPMAGFSVLSMVA